MGEFVSKDKFCLPSAPLLADDTIELRLQSIITPAYAAVPASSNLFNTKPECCFAIHRYIDQANVGTISVRVTRAQEVVQAL